MPAPNSRPLSLPKHEHTKEAPLPFATLPAPPHHCQTKHAVSLPCPIAVSFPPSLSLCVHRKRLALKSDELAAALKESERRAGQVAGLQAELDRQAGVIREMQAKRAAAAGGQGAKPAPDAAAKVRFGGGGMEGLVEREVGLAAWAQGGPAARGQCVGLMAVRRRGR